MRRSARHLIVAGGVVAICTGAAAYHIGHKAQRGPVARDRDIARPSSTVAQEDRRHETVQDAGRSSRNKEPAKLTPNVTLDERLAEIGPNARLRLRERFSANGIAFPPAEIALVAVKDESKLELFVRGAKGAPWRLVDVFPLLAQSGGLGPKLRQGDHQVPEGSYRVSFLNANSLYHVSMRLDYPNRFDREMAARDRRTNLGGDIMIHGKAMSVGCLAVGDLAAEELFVLAADVGIRNVEVLVVPTDFIRGQLVPASLPVAPSWLPMLYADLSRRLAAFRPS